MSGQLDSLGQVLGGPILGVVGNASLRAALVVTGVSLAPALALYVRAAGQVRRRAGGARAAERAGGLVPCSRAPA